MIHICRFTRRFRYDMMIPTAKKPLMCAFFVHGKEIRDNMNERRTELVLWDWNGTLQDDAGAAFEAVNDMLARRAMPPITFEQYSSYIETPIIGFYRHIFDLEKVPFEVIIKEFGEGFDLHMKGRGLMPGALEALARLDEAGIRQVIVSSSEKGVLLRYAESYGIKERFADILAADDFDAGSKVERARGYMRRCGIPPERTVMLGDMLHDAEVAEAVGARCILIAKGHQIRRELARSGAVIVDSIGEAAELILAGE